MKNARRKSLRGVGAFWKSDWFVSLFFWKFCLVTKAAMVPWASVHGLIAQPQGRSGSPKMLGTPDRLHMESPSALGI